VKSVIQTASTLDLSLPVIINNSFLLLLDGQIDSLQVLHNPQHSAADQSAPVLFPQASTSFQFRSPPQPRFVKPTWAAPNRQGRSRPESPHDLSDLQGRIQTNYGTVVRLSRSNSDPRETWCLTSISKPSSVGAPFTCKRRPKSAAGRCLQFRPAF
jgi:hypothetical protein